MMCGRASRKCRRSCRPESREKAATARRDCRVQADVTDSLLMAEFLECKFLCGMMEMAKETQDKKLSRFGCQHLRLFPSRGKLRLRSYETKEIPEARPKSSCCL